MIIGQDELVELTMNVARGADGASPALLLEGPTGIGKSTLLRNAVTSVSDGDIRVLFAAAGAQDSSQPFQSLNELLWPIVDAVENLPAPLRLSLSEALQSSPAPRPPQMLLKQAVLALFAMVAKAAPVLLVVDDVDKLDRYSHDVLVHVIARLTGARVRALLSARHGALPNGMDRVAQVVEVAPLDDRHAAELLETQLRPPAPALRGELVRWSRGNPLALIESARACARTGVTKFRVQGIAGPGGGYAQFVGLLAGLPPDCRALMRHAAAGIGTESVDAITEAAGLGPDLSRWDPAVSAGLLTITDDGLVRFGHPLLRTAAYAESTPHERRIAHLALSESARLDPLCRAWHAASAAGHPDENTAAALETAVLRRGDDLYIARGLQRAAELSTDNVSAARRYGLAARAANFAGDPAWARSLSDRAVAGTDDATLRGYAIWTRASVLLQSARLSEANGLIHSVLDDPNPPPGSLALHLVTVAASAAYYSGDRRQRDLLRRWLSRMPDARGAGAQLPGAFPADAVDLQRAYIGLLADGTLDERWQRPGPAAVEPYRRLVTGVAAYLAEDSATAALDLAQAVDLFTDAGGLRGFTHLLAPLAWALLDTGRWTALSGLLDDAAAMPAVSELTLLDGEIASCRAQLLAYRGDRTGSQNALNRARNGARHTGESLATEVASIRAAGWSASGAGDFEGAYQVFRRLFGTDGRPAHFVVSYRGMAELAWSAARCGRTAEARTVIAGIADRLGSRPPVRLGLLRHQALALVATPDREAEHHYRLAVFDPAGQDWPLEQARARLHYGEWLRRTRRPSEARTQLSAALETFDRLGAHPLADIAASELRAAGGASPPTRTPAALEGLTAQQQQIVTLAASGLTNREIAARLKLSPRTIGSHLYQAYPKLGVSRRHELREFAPQGTGPDRTWSPA